MQTNHLIKNAMIWNLCILDSTTNLSLKVVVVAQALVVVVQPLESQYIQIRREP